MNHESSTRSEIHEAGKLADFGAALTTADAQELQEVLATLNVTARIEKTLLLLKKELELSRLQSQISKQVEDEISAASRLYLSCAGRRAGLGCISAVSQLCLGCAGRRQDLCEPAAVHADGAAQADQEGARPRAGRQGRPPPEVRRPDQGAQRARGGEQGHRRGDGEDRHARVGVLRVQRDAKLPRLAHLPPVGHPLGGEL